MKEGWDVESLEDLCQFSNGLWKGEKEPLAQAGVIRNTNFAKDGALDFSDIAYLDVEAKKLAKRQLQYGDIILEKSGGGPKQPVGRVALFDRHNGTFSFSNFTSAIRVKNSDRLDFRFLHKFLYWTHLSGVTEGMQSHSTGIRNLDGDAYKKIKVPFPSLSEQQRIVAILDEAFEGIAVAKANAEKNLQNALDVYESFREGMVSGNDGDWEARPLSELCDIRHGYAFKSEYFSEAGEYTLLTPGNFHEAGGYRDRGEKQKYYSGPIPSGFILSKGDLLVAMTEQAAGLLGSPILVPESGRFLHNQRLGLVVSKPGTPWLNEFFFHVFNLRRIRTEIHGSATGVKVRHTSPGKLGSVVVSFPPSLSEQKRIVVELDGMAREVARLESVYRQKIAALDGLKKSLLHHAFSGQL